jgi:hypothetical protein
MRFGRDSNGAVIYVSTAALLDWLPIAGRGNVVKWSDGMREVIAAIRDRDEWRTGDLSLSIDERQVRRHLDNLHQYGLIERRDERGGWTWMNTGALADVNDDQQAIRFWTPES